MVATLTNHHVSLVNTMISEKTCIQMYLESHGDKIWSDVKHGLFIPTTVINNVEQPKVQCLWNDNNKKKVL